MAKLNDIKVNITVNSDIDAKKVIEKLYEEITKGLSVNAEVMKKEPPLKAGDYAEVISEELEDLPKGSLVKITKKGNYECYKAELLDGSNYEYVEVHEVRILSKEESRWAAIGRKPGEFKEGDIIKYKCDGELCEVFDVGGGKVEVQTLGSGINAELPEYIELITPVEARFDR